jgi:hypothetical protein
MSRTGPVGCRPEEIDMGYKFRTDRDMSDASEPTPVLDRAWAATRPAGLPPEAVDRIWGEVERACERPEILTMGPSPRSGHLVAAGLLGAVLAFAASMVAAVWFTVQPDVNHPIPLSQLPPNSDPTTATQAATVLVTSHEVDEYETFMISINEKGFVKEERTKPSDAGSALAYLDVPANSAKDMLDKLESISP